MRYIKSPRENSLSRSDHRDRRINISESSMSPILSDEDREVLKTKAKEILKSMLNSTSAKEDNVENEVKPVRNSRHKQKYYTESQEDVSTNISQLEEEYDKTLSIIYSFLSNLVTGADPEYVLKNQRHYFEAAESMAFVFMNYAKNLYEELVLGQES